MQRRFTLKALTAAGDRPGALAYAGVYEQRYYGRVTVSRGPGDGLVVVIVKDENRAPVGLQPVEPEFEGLGSVDPLGPVRLHQAKGETLGIPGSPGQPKYPAAR